MIIVLMPSEPTAEDLAEEAFAEFSRAVHGRVPFGHAIDLHTDTARERGICGDHGRVLPTRQWLCPICAGYLHDAAHVQRMQEMAARLAEG